MPLSIATTDTLATVLPRIDRAVFNREPAALASLRSDYDYEIRLPLRNSLVATPRHGGEAIEARMSTLRPRHSYTIVADGREIDCECTAAHGNGIAVSALHELSLRDARGTCGHVYYLANTNFVLTGESWEGESWEGESWDTHRFQKARGRTGPASSGSLRMRASAQWHAESRGCPRRPGRMIAVGLENDGCPRTSTRTSRTSGPPRTLIPKSVMEITVSPGP